MAIEYKFSVSMTAALKQQAVLDKRDLYGYRVEKHIQQLKSYDQLLTKMCTFVLLPAAAVGMFLGFTSGSSLLFIAAFIVTVASAAIGLHGFSQMSSGQGAAVSQFAMSSHKRKVNAADKKLAESMVSHHKYEISVGEKFIVQTPELEAAYVPTELKFLVKNKTAYVSESWKLKPRTGFIYFETEAQLKKVEEMVTDAGGEVVKL